MKFDISNIARRIQPTAVLVSVSKLLKRIDDRQPQRMRRQRRSMNG